MQEKARAQSLLNLAIEQVKIYQAHLGAAESQVTKAEDLIGDIRFRLRERGVLINPLTSVPYASTTAPPLPPPDETTTSSPAPAETVNPLPGSE
jgi:hypothetical protein